MEMANKEIKTVLAMAKLENIHHYQVADVLGVSEPTLNRWLRKEMSEDKKQRILDAIESLKK